MTCFRANSSSLGSSMLSVALDMSYMTTNFSRILWSSSPSTGGYWLRFLKTVDSSGYTFHVCHALFSPLPWNADTTSQPVNAWKNRRPIEGLIYGNPLFCPWPNVTYSFSTPRSCRSGRTLTAMTRTYVSLALIIILLLPSAAACFECRRTRVSAFSWLQWVSPSRLIDWLQTTPSSWVNKTVLLEYIFTILSARKLNNSVLLLLCQVIPFSCDRLQNSIRFPKNINFITFFYRYVLTNMRSLTEQLKTFRWNI